MRVITIFAFANITELKAHAHVEKCVFDQEASFFADRKTGVFFRCTL